MVDHTDSWAIRLLGAVMWPDTRDVSRPAEDATSGMTNLVVAADALVECWPEVEHEATLAAVLRANAAAVVGCGEDVLYEFDVHPLLLRVAALTELLDDRVRVEGPDRPGTQQTRRALARRSRGGETWRSCYQQGQDRPCYHANQRRYWRYDWW